MVLNENFKRHFLIIGSLKIEIDREREGVTEREEEGERELIFRETG